MRSIYAQTLRACARHAPKRSIPVFRASSGIRWSSSSPTTTDDTRQWSTPLAKQLAEAITATGPVPLASYMRMCLTGDIGGYYTTKQEGRDQFGQKGDFITSPEISQVFGELIGIWFVAEWMAQGRQKGVELIEIGPGRGTLMDDILRTIRNFKPMASSIEAIYLVEASPALREAQKQLLCGDAPMTETELGYRSISKYANLPVIWSESIKHVPKDPTRIPFIVAHEFFDALPIHAFQSVPPNPNQESTITTPTGVHKVSSTAKEPQWRELMVSPASPDATHSSLGTPKSLQDSEVPDFELTLSKASTPHSLYLPEISRRYKALKNTPDSLIEISPESRIYAQEFAKRIGGSPDMPKEKPSGAALILDYGPADTIPTNSLRGIRNHRRVSPLSAPGLVDISVDVDFIALAEAALEGSEGVEVHGPVEQGTFLTAMGIKERAEMLIKNINASDEARKKEVQTACQRLVDRGGSGMGKVYKALAIIPEGNGKRRPVGFGGDIVG